MTPKAKKNLTKHLRLPLYVAVIILLNLASASLFIRIDSTKDRVYSLSEASKKTVATLAEPLTIKAFFSKDLPAPYNNTEQQLRDLLEEYAVYGSRYFNYSFHSIDMEAGGKEEELSENEQLAQNYSIRPIQIQTVEKDQVKLQNAYMGVVFIHGDMIEIIPALTSTERLEYHITNTINKLNNKIRALLGLTEDIQIKLFLSSSLYELEPSMAQFPQQIARIVSDLNQKHYDRLQFSHVDPTDNPGGLREAQYYRISPWYLGSSREQGKGEETYATLLINYQTRSFVLPLLVSSFFGYEVVERKTIEQVIEGSTETLIGTNEEIGYLADHNSPSLYGGGSPENPRQISLYNYNRIVSETYSFKEVMLKEGEIPEGLGCLVIVSPTEEFSDYELFQIDQFLMGGNSLLIFLDSHQEFLLPQEYQSGVGPQAFYVPLQTGLEKLIEHYGVRVKPTYILDKQCYIQRQQTSDGGLFEIPVYYAPLIKEDNINQELDFLHGIKGLIMLNISSIELLRENDQDLLLFSSSETSWEMTKDINLTNPLYIMPPPDGEMRASQPLAYILQEGFTSYFADKPLPRKKPEKPTERRSDEKKRLIATEEVSGGIQFLRESEGGKIFVIGSSVILNDNVVDSGGVSSNAIFLLNVLDYMNNRMDFALMRSKALAFNPLKETSPQTRTFVKTFNMAGLPILVILAGILIWLCWTSRKKRIKALFLNTASPPDRASQRDTRSSRKVRARRNLGP